MRQFIFEQNSIDHYAETRNNLMGSEYSSKLAPWFANGSLSVRIVYFAVRNYESQKEPSRSTQLLIDHLLVRDYSNFWYMRNHEKASSAYGIHDETDRNW